MQLRIAMILVLVAWCVTVASCQEARPAPNTSTRRSLHKRRLLERLAARGLDPEEQESAAQELLARLDHLAHSAPAQQPYRLKRHHHQHHSNNSPTQLEDARRSFEHTAALLVDERPALFVEAQPSILIEERPPLSEILRHSQQYPELPDLTEPLEPLAPVLQHEDIEEGEELVRGIPSEYLGLEPLEDLQRTARGPTSTNAPDTSRTRKNRRNERREGRKKKRKDIKAKRNRKKRRKLDAEVQDLVDRKIIPLHEAEDGEKYIDCCPSVQLDTRKMFGKSPTDNRAMEIKEGYQHFKERVCLTGYDGRECIFPQKSLRKSVKTRCVQQYSLAQVPVRYPAPDGSPADDYEMGFIQIHSGCSCQVSVNHKKKRRKRRKR